MNSELANKLKTILDEMSQDQFDREWNAITAFQFEGPSFTDAIEYFAVAINQSGSYQLNSSVATGEFNLEKNYSKAA